jgi:Tfp pilus assembly PilM family ATPase
MTMLGLFGKHVCPIGVDLGNGYLQMAQIGSNGHGLFLHAAGIAPRPQEVEPQSPAWQRWAIDAIKELLHKGDFTGKSVIAALSSDDLFIEPIKVPRHTLDKLDEAVLPFMQKKLPFAPQDGMIRCIPVESTIKSPEAEVIVMATQRCKIDRMLAIYEKVGLDVVEMTIWPTALMNSYRNFFSRRKNDQGRVAILLDFGSHSCNVVIGRGSELLFARVIPIGCSQLDQHQSVPRLVAEIDSCCRYFETIAGGLRIERILLMVGKNIDKNLCDQIVQLAQKMQIPAQIGDVLSAIEIREGLENRVDRRNSQLDWALAFGLSLEGMGKK